MDKNYEFLLWDYRCTESQVKLNWFAIIILINRIVPTEIWEYTKACIDFHLIDKRGNIKFV